MPLDSTAQPRDPEARPPLALHIPTTLTGGALALALVIYCTWKGFSDSGLYLFLMVLVPVVIFLLSRPHYFLMTMLAVSFARFWLPLGPPVVREIPSDFYVRSALIAAVLAGAIIRKGTHGSGFAAYRMFAMLFIALIGLTMVVRGVGFLQLGGNLVGGRVYLVLLSNLLFLLVVPRVITMTRGQWLATFLVILAAPLAILASDLLYLATGGRSFALYYLFRPDTNIGTAAFELGQQNAGLWRFQSLSLLRFSWLGILLFPWLRRHWWGWITMGFLVVLNLALTSVSGFRGALLVIPLTVYAFLWLQYPRNRLLLTGVTAGAGLLAVLALFVLAPHLPLPAQRAISWIPGLKLSPLATLSASHSSEWRLDLWHLVWTREVPRYWLFGRGLAWPLHLWVDQIGPFEDHWATIHNFVLNGEFHNGPLILLVCFGIWGLLIFTGLMFAALLRFRRFLRMEWGDPILRHFFLFQYTLLAVGVFSFYFIFGDLQAPLQAMVLNIVLMEMLIRSDPALGKPAVAVEVPLLVGRRRPAPQPVAARPRVGL